MNGQHAQFLCGLAIVVLGSAALVTDISGRIVESRAISRTPALAHKLRGASGAFALVAFIAALIALVIAFRSLSA